MEPLPGTGWGFGARTVEGTVPLEGLIEQTEPPERLSSHRGVPPTMHDNRGGQAGHSCWRRSQLSQHGPAASRSGNDHRQIQPLIGEDQAGGESIGHLLVKVEALNRSRHSSPIATTLGSARAACRKQGLECLGCPVAGDRMWVHAKRNNAAPKTFRRAGSPEISPGSRRSEQRTTTSFPAALGGRQRRSASKCEPRCGSGCQIPPKKNPTQPEEAVLGDWNRLAGRHVHVSAGRGGMERLRALGGGGFDSPALTTALRRDFWFSPPVLPVHHANA